MALTDKLSAIANALRSKTGGTGQMTLDEIAAEIQGLSVGSGGESVAPENASSWMVGNWVLNGTGAEATKSRCYYTKKMASGVAVTNNTSIEFRTIAASINSSGKVIAVSSEKTLSKNGGSTTFTNSSAHHMYVILYSVYSVMGSSFEGTLSAQGLFEIAKNVQVTGTEVS